MGLNRRVRYGNGCDPHAYRRQIFQGIDPWTVKHISPSRDTDPHRLAKLPVRLSAPAR